MTMPLNLRKVWAVPRKLRRNVRQRGVINTIRLAFHKLRLAFRPNLGDQIELEYDALHNVDTSGKVDVGLLNVAGPNMEYGNRYQAINPYYFAALMSHVSRPDRFVFIDVGSGKGRALFLASDYPFKEIIGVEFALELHECALRNISTYRSNTQKCARIHSVCVDAARYEFPDESLIVYMNNPFEEQVMTGVLRNLRQSLEKRPRPMQIIYLNPTLKPLLEREGFKVVAESLVEKTTYLVLSLDHSMPGCTS